MPSVEPTFHESRFDLFLQNTQKGIGATGQLTAHNQAKVVGDVTPGMILAY